MKTTPKNETMQATLRLLFAAPVVLLLLVVEALSRQPVLACVGPDLPADDVQPVTTAPVLFMASANQISFPGLMNPVEDLDEIGWDDLIPFTVREWDVDDPDAVLPYGIPAASRPSTAAPADPEPTFTPSTRAKPAGVDVVQRALALIAEGKSKREAARLLHVPDSTLRRWISQRTTTTA